MAIENITEAQKANLVKLYLAYFNRAPETQGLDFHVAAFLADLNAGLSEDQAFANRADNFYQAAIDVPAWSGYSVSMTTAEFVAKMYDNVLLRPGAGGDAPSAEDISYWVEQLESGAVTRGGLITSFLDAVPHLIANGTPEEVAIATQVQTVLDARLAVALEFVKPEYSGALTGEEAFNAGKNVLVGVVDPDSAADRISELESAANTVTLTEGVDILTGNVFEAPRGFTPGGTDQVNTLDDDDVLTGTGTNPTLNFTFVDDADTGDVDINPTLIGIETVNVNVRLSTDGELDLQDSTGVENINISGIDDSLVFSVDNIQSAAKADGSGLDLSINNSNDDGAEILFQFDTDAVAGAFDVVNLTLNDVDVAVVSIDDEDDQAQLGIETVNLESTGGSNEVGVLVIEDAEQLVVTGDQDLRLGNRLEAVRPGTAQVEAILQTAGLGLVAGSLHTVDASAFTGDLDIGVGDETIFNLDETSGTEVDFTVIGGSGNDTIRLLEGLDSDDDTIDGGAGDNTLQVYASVTDGTISNMQLLDIRGNGESDGAVDDTITVDTSLFTGLETIWIRNEASEFGVTDTGEALTTVLNELTAELAQQIFVQHSTTGSNAREDNVLVLNLADSSGAADEVTITFVDKLDNENRGVNIDQRFNFTVDADDVESITLNDDDSESNTVDIVEVADLTGTLTLTGGMAGDFLNLDNADLAGTGFGIYGVAVDGSENDEGADNDNTGSADLVFQADTATGVDRIIAETIDASAHVGDVIVRVGEEMQDITMGSGDDTVVFDAQANNTAGLTVADNVDGGEGDDTLALEGNARVTIGGSEWLNVSNFENILLVGNENVATNDDADAFELEFGENSYNIRLTDELLTQNGVEVGGVRTINIRNDNDLTNEAATTNAGLNGAITANNSGVTIDATQLNSGQAFNYNGEEGDDQTRDRFIMSDTNINGRTVIDGGAVDVDGTANGDILEVRATNTGLGAQVTADDLANVSNVGTLEFVNNTANDITHFLELTNEIVDQLVNSYHTAEDAPGETETLTIAVWDNPDLPTAETTLILDLSDFDGGEGEVLAFEGNGSVQLVGFSLAEAGAAGFDFDAFDGTVDFGDGNVVDFSGTTNTIFGTPGPDTLNGTAANDTIFALDGADTVNGGDGDDVTYLGDDGVGAEGDSDIDTIVFDATSAGDNETVYNFEGYTDPALDVVDLSALGLATINYTAAALAEGDAMGSDVLSFVANGAAATTGDNTLYVDVNGNGLFNAADDLVVTLVGAGDINWAAQVDFV